MVVLQNIKHLKNRIVHFSSNIQQKPPWSVLFFGADDFSMYSLKLLYNEYLKGSLLNSLEVVTTIKKKANPVQKFATHNKLLTHNWPYLVPQNKFHVGILVSFGHLIPENIIGSFPYGILNIHPSLLPRWRGAAPIVHTLANGDHETGVTIMRIRPKQFDVGEIVVQSKIHIKPNMKMPELHQILGNMGASCLVSTLEKLPEALQQVQQQANVGVTYAPKITPEFAVINWQQMSSLRILNLDRAISGFLVPTCLWKGTPVKLYEIQDCSDNFTLNNNNNEICPGYVEYVKPSNTLRIVCADKACISVKNVGVYGKKVMSAKDFYNGFLTKVPKNERYFT